MPTPAATHSFSRRTLLGALCAAALVANARGASAGNADLGAESEDLDGLVTFPGKLDAPALQLADLKGRVHDVADYRGRVLVVNFWATWCGPCIAEMASMERASTVLRARGVDIVAVNAGDKPDTVRRFLATHPVSFPVLLDPSTRAAAAWHVGGMPTSYVVDPAGEITAGALGGRDWDAPQMMASLTRIASPSR